MKILVIGENGQLGYELRRTLAPAGNVLGIDLPDLNLADPCSIRDCLESAAPDLIVNAAAYTDVDKAEVERTLARQINADAVRVLAEWAKPMNAAIIHYSTDYVFDGNGAEPYTEDDHTDPLNWYGSTKLEGEMQLAAAGAPYFIFRTSWLYSTRGKNFLLSVLRLAEQQKELRVVADQVGAPTWARMVAEATAGIVTNLRGVAWDVERVRQYSGIYHLTAAGATSWAGFARAILRNRRTSLHDHLNSPSVADISANEYPSRTVRPRWSVLSNVKVSRTFGITLPDWCEQLRLALA